MIDVQAYVLRSFAIDHVLVSFVNLKTIVTTGAIFSLQLTARTRCGSLIVPPDLLAAIGGVLLRGGEVTGEGEGKGKERKGRKGWEGKPHECGLVTGLTRTNGQTLHDGIGRAYA